MSMHYEIQQISIQLLAEKYATRLNRILKIKNIFNSNTSMNGFLYFQNIVKDIGSVEPL